MKNAKFNIGNIKKRTYYIHRRAWIEKMIIFYNGYFLKSTYIKNDFNNIEVVPDTDLGY